MNINKDFPNIFNDFLSSLTELGKYGLPWDIKCFKESNHLAIANGYDSVSIYNIENPYYPSKSSSIPC